MIKSLLKIAVDNPVLANLLAVLILVGGYISSGTMIKEIFPNFSLDMINVTIAYPGADPYEIEEGIILKLETALEGIDGIKEISYEARRGSGKAIIECKNGSDLFRVKDEVTSRVDAINDFPVDSEKPVIVEVKIRSDVLTLAVWGDLPVYQLKEFAVELKDRILLLNSVTYAEVAGVRDYEISVEIPDESLVKYNINFDDVKNAIRNNSFNSPAGEIETGTEKANVRIEGRNYFASEYSRIPVLTTATGQIITIGEIGSVKDSFDSENKSITKFNGRPAALVVVYKTESEDSIKIASDVENMVREMKAGLPSGLHITKFRDYSRLIDGRLTLLVKNGIIGLIIVIFVLWLFLDMRLSFWITMGIPISIGGALIIMAFSDSSINMLTMFGLIMVLGLIVDDAIVIGESIYSRREQGDSDVNAAINGASEVMMPVISAVITTIIAFVPLFFIPGVMGKFIKQIPIPVVAALAVSLLEGILILPVHLRHLPSGSFKGKFFLTSVSIKIRGVINRLLFTFIDKVYTPVLKFSLSNYYAVLILALSLIVIFAALFKGGVIKYIFMPESDSDFIYARIELPPGTPAASTLNVSNLLLKGLEKVEENYVAKTGKPLTVAQLYRVGRENNILNVEVEMTPSEERNLYYTEVLKEWKKEVGEIPGAFVVRFDSSRRGPGGNPIEFQLLGSDYENLMAASNELINRLASIKGVIEPQSDIRSGMKEYQVKIDPSAYHYGITLSDISQHIRGGLEGAEAMKIQRGRDEIKVKVRYPEGQVNSIDYLKNLKIKTKNGELIPLMSLVKVTLQETERIIRRKFYKRIVNVSADINQNEANAQEIMSDIHQEFLPYLARKYNITYRLEGQAKETSQSLGSLIRLGIPFAIFAMYFIIASLFKSYLQPAIILFTIPFGVVGAVIGHMIFGKDITLMSIFGIVAVAGIVINDSIVFMEAFNKNLEEGVEVKDALCMAGRKRFRAILLTTLTTFFGLAPLVVEKSVQAQFIIPMAISISFGVLFCTLVTLIIIPSVTMIISDIRRLVSFIMKGTLPDRESVEPRYTPPLKK